MNLQKAVESVGTFTELKRTASAYVIDYKNLSEDEVRAAIIKTAPQYSNPGNLQSTLEDLFLADNRNHRLLSRMMLVDVVVQSDEFMCPKKETDDRIIALEQAIIDRSNEDLLQRSSDRRKDISLFRFVLETAWEHKDGISVDEKNLIEKMKTRLKITETEYQIIEAKLGKYPKPGNQVHTREEIEEVRRLLQARGVLFSVRDEDGTDFDVLPDEIAATFGRVLGIEMRRHGYTELLAHKYVKSKNYLFSMLKKCDISVDPNLTLNELRQVCLDQVPPSTLLGGISPRDGLDQSLLKQWCAELELNVSGHKVDLISRIIGYYDGIHRKESTTGDERELWYDHFEAFAHRDLEFLRHQQLIQKDLECESKFEGATEFLFEKKLFHKPLQLVGTAHADGALSFQDKVIFWDNKSKETPVNLRQHIHQFDAYIKSSERQVACFIVIAPDFTPDSSALAMQYNVMNGTVITLITAQELKQLAEAWSAKTPTRGEEPFPLGYLIQPGRFDRDLVAAL